MHYTSKHLASDDVHLHNLTVSANRYHHSALIGTKKMQNSARVK